jgi:pre-mRNA-processing factor 19
MCGMCSGGRGYDVIHSVGTFDASVNGVVIHPTKDYFAACGANASWGFYDLALGTTLAVLKDTDVDDFSSMDVHPDGLLFGFGTSSGQLRLWDIQNQSHAATLSGPSDEIKNISFSENGYYVCVSHENSVQVWDLRKLKTVFSMPAVEGTRYVSGRFDSYGHALGVVSSKNLNVFTAAKKIDSICSIEMADVELTTGVFANKSSLFVGGCTDGRYAFFSL